jgi:hypothetical protein
MKRALLVALVVLAPALAQAKGQKTARAEKPSSERSTERAPATSDKGDASETSAAAPTKTADGKTIKTKTYTFGAMDVEGKLKTPQLLFFLNRVKLELDMSAPDKRSFMKELVKSADDKSL